MQLGLQVDIAYPGLLTLTLPAVRFMIARELAPLLVTLKGSGDVNGPWTTTSAPTDDEVVTPLSSVAGSLQRQTAFLICLSCFRGRGP